MQTEYNKNCFRLGVQKVDYDKMIDPRMGKKTLRQLTQ